MAAIESVVTTPTPFRKGVIGALMDEYERAVSGFGTLLHLIPEGDYVRVVDWSTQDEDCRSVQTIVAHVVDSGYACADQIRAHFGLPSGRPSKVPTDRQTSLDHLEVMLRYTARSLDGRWGIADEEIARINFRVNHGPTYNLEQFLEHAIVHVLRHRRQIERFMYEGRLGPGW